MAAPVPMLDTMLIDSPVQTEPDFSRERELMARGADEDAIFEVLGIGEEGMPMPGRRRRVPALVDDD